jgi:hypothetical protein
MQWRLAAFGCWWRRQSFAVARVMLILSVANGA